ncbi:hypothetical protein AUR04nite_07500 [Glutamicibacter uratoxydans]|uniref:Luciferase-like domain-containing protein n=1 Tax=Glutamicibacter uratoxydans TaxID=43667 RepID=A0A4Y4DPB9_GLUUR|nr:LLM class flavin-dependent oxidoreductase [Glutamicibacter uratoxydans]GED05218.1 hypothetical protein AUR04nite_07500 [Glutamicibacter uratoxydans]
MSQQTLLLALNLDGAGSDPHQTADEALRAESAGFHAVSFTSDGLLDPVQRASYAAAQTRNIGLLPVIDALFTEPFHTATQLASLDIISGGRAGWFLAARNEEQLAAAVGRTPLQEDQLGIEAADVVAVHRRLWDSWEADAVIRDHATGRYLDARKLHYVEVAGQNFSVKGPAITPRPPQGQLPIIAPAGLFTTPGLRHCRLDGADVAAINAADPQTLLSKAEKFSATGAVAIELDVYLDAAGEPAQHRRDAQPQAQRTERTEFIGSAQELVDFIRAVANATENPADQRRHLIHLYPGDLQIDGPELVNEVLPQLKDLLAPVQDSLRESFALPVAHNRFKEAA